MNFESMVKESIKEHNSCTSDGSKFFINDIEGIKIESVLVILLRILAREDIIKKEE